MDTQVREMRFDVVLSFDINPKDGLKLLHEEISQAYPEYKVLIVPDVDISD